MRHVDSAELETKVPRGYVAYQCPSIQRSSAPIYSDFRAVTHSRRSVESVSLQRRKVVSVL